MSIRFDNTFKTLRSKKEGAFVPFVTLHDPDYGTSLEILKTLHQNGADILELGFPFSDPCADGPTIQKGNKRALASGSTTMRCLNLIKEYRLYDDKTPISLLIYANLITSFGIEEFFIKVKESGVDCVLIADVPTIMADCVLHNFAEKAKNKVDLVFIAPPDASKENLNKIAQMSESYIYCVSRTGITGNTTRYGRPYQTIKYLKSISQLPLLVGFGIASVADVQDVMSTHADGCICGSAIVSLIEKNLNNKEIMLHDIGAFVTNLKQACR